MRTQRLKMLLTASKKRRYFETILVIISFLCCSEASSQQNDLILFKDIAVTNLNDRGPGSLRQAVNSNLPRRIVFSVSGTIELKQPIVIEHDFVEISGETAPREGITIRGKIVVNASYVTLKHLRIRQKDESLTMGNSFIDKARTRDSISIGKGRFCKKKITGIVLSNLSISWATDENFGSSRDCIDDLMMERSIISEGLLNGYHPKGPHSMGALISSRSKSVIIKKNLFFSNYQRNPLIDRDSSFILTENVLYNVGNIGIHVRGPCYSFLGSTRQKSAIVGNIFVIGPDTSRNVDWIRIDGPSEDCDLNIEKNLLLSDAYWSRNLGARTRKLLQEPSKVRLVGKVDLEELLSGIGAYPGRRDQTDMRIISEFYSRQGRIPNKLSELP